MPAVSLGVSSSRESSVNRGEQIFAQAGSVKDSLGFMSQVKSELDELVRHDAGQEVRRKPALHETHRRSRLKARPKGQTGDTTPPPETKARQAKQETVATG